MPSDKDFKRLVRGRMRKTGESYTTARLHLRKQEPSGSRAAPAPSKTISSARSAGPAAADYARLAGRSDAILKERTGCTWERWVKALDRAGAHEWPHPKIAKYVQEKYKITGWWAQAVTVGYERIKGLRAVGQRRDGSFEAHKSRTYAVPLARLYAAWHDPRLRARWIPDVELTVRTATREKSMRITWPDRTSLEVGFLSQGAAKSQVALSHAKLPDRDAVARLKEYWGERLDALGKMLSTGL